VIESEPEDVVIKIARQMYQHGWTYSTDVSKSTREAQTITKEWQARVRAANKSRYAAEVKVSTTFRERIDLVDRHTGTAYEMKVSGKNPTHEFFKDVFKVMEHNTSGGGRILHLVFLTHSLGVARLNGGLGRALAENAYDIGFKVIFKSLDHAAELAPTEKKVQEDEAAVYSKCSGRGRGEGTCEACQGWGGFVGNIAYSGDATAHEIREIHCDACNDTGKSPCSTCSGTGHVSPSAPNSAPAAAGSAVRR